MEINWKTIAIAAVCLLFLIYIVRKDQERFSLPATLQDGLYLIKNNGTIFTSTAFTPTQCNNFAFQKPQPSMEDSWVLKKVSNGVYMLQKPGGKECLYTHIDGSLKSYLIADCDRKNLCGSEELDSNGELDQYSIRSYFKLSNGPDGKVILQSMQNNQFVCMTNGTANFKTAVDQSCMFDFQKL